MYLFLDNFICCDIRSSIDSNKFGNHGKIIVSEYKKIYSYLIMNGFIKFSNIL